VKQTLSVMVGTAQHQYAVEMVLDEFVFPDLIEGKFLRVPPEELVTMAFGIENVTAFIRGKRYKFDRLQKDGTFVLHKDF
jgi:hypothetical protein